MNRPWYEPKSANKQPSSIDIEKRLSRFFDPQSGLFSQFKFFLNGLLSVLMAIAGGLSFGIEPQWVGVCMGLFFIGLAVLFLLKQIGRTVHRSLPKYNGLGTINVALDLSKGNIKSEEIRSGIPAPEQALLQFVQQVRAYANEKSFQRVKQTDRALNAQPLIADTADLLRRRWNEVLDSLSEFEIYLANDPEGVISKLITQQSLQVMDLSQIFREVADSFDVSWRRKGINIESAIVTPLKATTSEALLRRMLVGPWRTTAYLARRGGGVIFSAKSTNGVTVARWECEGIGLPEEYVTFAKDSSKSVNERLEKGLVVLAAEGNNNTNVLFGLISFLTWIDLANASHMDYDVKLTDDGFAIELRLK